MDSLPQIKIAYAVEWTEYERGWGPRPDGFSLHPDEQAAEDFSHHVTKDYTGPAPDTYIKPDGKPFAVSVADGVEIEFTTFGNKAVRVNRLPEGVKKL